MTAMALSVPLICEKAGAHQVVVFEQLVHVLLERNGSSRVDDIVYASHQCAAVPDAQAESWQCNVSIYNHDLVSHLF